MEGFSDSIRSTNPVRPPSTERVVNASTGRHDQSICRFDHQSPPLALKVLPELAGEPQGCFLEDEPLAKLHESVVAELYFPAIALAVKVQAAVLAVAVLPQ